MAEQHSAGSARGLRALVTAWGNWHNEILTYFDHPITNAYTESLSNLIRVMNRIGRGYSFEALPAKIPFTEAPQKHKAAKLKFERVNRREPFVAMRAVSALSYDVPTWDDEPERNLGVDIPQLVEMIEKGALSRGIAEGARAKSVHISFYSLRHGGYESDRRDDERG